MTVGEEHDRIHDESRNITVKNPNSITCQIFNGHRIFKGPLIPYIPSKCISQLIESRGHLLHQILFDGCQQPLVLCLWGSFFALSPTNPQLLNDLVEHVDHFTVGSDILFCLAALSSFFFLAHNFGVTVGVFRRSVCGLVGG